MPNPNDAAERAAREKLLGQIGGKLTELAFTPGAGLKDLSDWLTRYRTSLVNGTPIRNRAPKAEAVGLKFGGEA